jgi:hypothetical protein
MTLDRRRNLRTFVELSTPIGPMSHMMQSHLQEVTSFQ